MPAEDLAMKCEWCDGAGEVLAYRGKPLPCSEKRGRRVIETIRTGLYKDVLAQFGKDGLRLMFDAKFVPDVWTVVACNRCGGSGLERDQYRVVQAG